ncbi:IucC family-domain-containing protein [Penicillium canariense]|uniref:IucC family-domain-containing protein n=1 Tax=Penicillium canariense TaxID=189055 RepID=A0A9W9IG77_9EURO|nr:IucC family-domain-containing protein [Penicillium canariense]KAJ5175036.1 IucC family-domain-containing protein [Penicillium canariense]
MTILSGHDQASFETTKRLLAEIVNEGLVSAKLEVTAPSGSQMMCIQSTPQDGSLVKVAIKAGTIIETRDDRVVSVVRPDSLQPPVTIAGTDDGELDPGTLFEFLSTSFGDTASETVLDEIVRELRNSADNQDRPADWERTLIYGHPSHPYHRLCYAQAPLRQITPEDIPGMLTPSLAFVSVPRANLRITGPFEQELQPLLENLEIPNTISDRVIVPCLAQQLPSIQQRFPATIVLKLTMDCADAQASMRTLTLRPYLEFKYHLKLSLACQITSALRTITPWTTCGGPVQTKLLERLLPNDLWVFREVAAISGSQDDFNDARHLSCILRDSLEVRAQANDETLIIAAALAQKPCGQIRTYAEILYGLETISQKKEWFQRYVTVLFQLVLPPLVQYGIGLEGHGQNLVARICLQTGRIKGFAVRDFGGIRMHVPTLRDHGVAFDSLPSGSATLTDNLQNVWSKVHHSLLQNHVGLLCGALGLENHGGWAITLETLTAVLMPDKRSLGKDLFEYFTKDTMPFKCFLRMRMEGKYRDYIEREVPNSLLLGSPRWKSILDTYKPSLHTT